MQGASSVAMTRESVARLARNLGELRSLLGAAAARSGREPGEVTLLAVTKYSELEHVRALHALGERDFGESTVQGLLSKKAALAELPGIRWHLIGHLQRNKVGKALEGAFAIHSIDSIRLAEQLARSLQARSGPLPQIYVELNVAKEGSKTGAPPEEASAILEVAGSAGLPVTGLMTMAPHSDDPERSREVFRQLRLLRDELVASGRLPPGSGLSMGMSGDFAVAVEEGATIVRVGSRLFEGLSGEV